MIENGRIRIYPAGQEQMESIISAEQDDELKKAYPVHTDDIQEESQMKDYIAYCGLDCEVCEAHIATINDDNDLRIKVAKEWSELNNVEITPDMINCSGCRIEGVKTPFCDSLCPIRQCGLDKGFDTCSDCSEMDICEKLHMITGNNEEALKRLKG